MSLVNTILVDLSAGQVTLASTESGVAVETIQYSMSTGEITISARTAITISGTDFMTLLNQIVIFQTAIIYNFTPTTIYIVPFNSWVCNESYISFTNAWTLVCNENGGSQFIDYYGTQSNGNVELITRAANLTIPFSEWVQLLVNLKHYQVSLSNFFGIPL